VKKMNRRVKKKWVEALRSGEFEQGQGALCRDGKYCCLGVLSELAVREGEAERWEGIASERTLFGRKRGDRSSSFLTSSVMRWAGLDTIDPQVTYEGEGDYLSSLNDSGRTFPEIADLIEAQL
jgi:hypothetical protein